MTVQSSRLRFGLGPLTAQTSTGRAAETTDELAILVEAVTLAERCGFDGAWVSEHHLSGDGYLTSPLVVLAALSMVTTRIDLGSAVVLAPLYSALRLAEEATLVDHLSRGRLLLGLGSGYRTEELEAFGVTPQARTRRLRETVASLRSVWTASCASPPPFRPHGPPILLGGYVERAVRRAGRLGDGWIAPTLSQPTQLVERLGWLEAEGSLDRPFHVVVNIVAFAGLGDAWSTAGAGISHVGDTYRRWAGRAATERRPDHVVVGPPAVLVDALGPWIEVLASLPLTTTAHLNLRLHFPGVGRQPTLDAIRLVGEEVIPRLRTKEAA